MIRQARPQDLDGAAELTKDAWLEMYERAGAMTEGNAEYIHGAKSVEGISSLRDWTDSVVLVSVGREGSVDGAAIASNFGIAGRARLISLVVSSKKRKRGIGTAILKKMEEVLAERGVRELELNALARLHDVVAFYEKRGYARDQRRPVDESVPTATVELSKMIGYMPFGGRSIKL